MDKIKAYLFFCFVFLFLSCSDNVKEAIEYNKRIVLSYQKVADIKDKLMFYILVKDTTHFDLEYKEFVNQINLSEKEIGEIGSFENYPDFNNAALSMMSVYKDVAKKEILDLRFLVKKKLQLNKQDSSSENVFGEKLHKLNSVLDSEFNKFETAQQKFAAKFNLNDGVKN